MDDGDVVRLTEAGFDVIKIRQGTMRTEVGGGEVAVVVPEDGNEAYLAYKSPKDDQSE